VVRGPDRRGVPRCGGIGKSCVDRFVGPARRCRRVSFRTPRSRTPRSRARLIERTGIRERCVWRRCDAGSGGARGAPALDAAARRARARAQDRGDHVGAYLPSLACLVQARLGLVSRPHLRRRRRVPGFCTRSPSPIKESAPATTGRCWSSAPTASTVVDPPTTVPRRFSATAPAPSCRAEEGERGVLTADPRARRTMGEPLLPPGARAPRTSQPSSDRWMHMDRREVSRTRSAAHRPHARALAAVGLATADVAPSSRIRRTCASSA
jgi:hypothetical protein